MVTKESEKALEARLVEEVRKRGGFALKLTSQFHRGMPDRLVLLPHHTMMFVEMKSTGESPTPLQEAAIAQLRGMKFACAVVDSTEALTKVLTSLDLRIEQQRLKADEYARRQKEAMKNAYDQFRADEKRRKDEERLGAYEV